MINAGKRTVMTVLPTLQQLSLHFFAWTFASCCAFVWCSVLHIDAPILHESASDQYAGETTSFDLGSETRRATRCGTCLRWVGVTPPMGRVCVPRGLVRARVWPCHRHPWPGYATWHRPPCGSWCLRGDHVDGIHCRDVAWQLDANVAAHQDNPEAFSWYFRDFWNGYQILSLVFVPKCHKREGMLWLACRVSATLLIIH